MSPGETRLLMPKILKIPFAKFHGLGNDFILVRDRDLPRSLPKLARSIANRHTGVGADGFLVVLPPRNTKHNARVRFFNADGSEPEVSGNGLRCVGAFLVGDRPARRPLKFETAAGVRSLKLVRAERNKWTFEVSMGPPIFAPAAIPFSAGNHPAPIVSFPLRTRSGVLAVTVTSMGNPHCTVFVADFASSDWRGLGAEIEANELFPNRTNVEFVKVISRHEIEVRYWERGVGETMSSGTGSCGATVACILNGLTERKVRVRTVAGNLEVEWPEKGDVMLTGPAERVAQGIYYFPG
jgi:diaminopimelate epimerase